MKKLLILSSLLLALNSKSQSTNTLPNFGQSVVSYFTGFNLNLTNTFSAAKHVDLWTSVDSIQGSTLTSAKLANALGVGYSVYGPIALENVFRTSGVAGTVVSDQLGVSLNFTVIDTRLSLYADAGYNLDNTFSSSKFKDNLFGEVGARVKKALTDNTYAGIGLGVQIPKAAQVYQVVVGATF